MPAADLIGRAERTATTDRRRRTGRSAARAGALRRQCFESRQGPRHVPRDASPQDESARPAPLTRSRSELSQNCDTSRRAAAPRGCSAPEALTADLASNAATRRRNAREKPMTKVDVNIALKAPFAKRYDNYIGGEWRAPAAGKYFDNISPITGQPVCEIARSDEDDIEAALDAAHAAKDAWGRTSPAERAQILNAIADRMEANLATLGDRRDLGQRQADPRDDGRRRAAGDRPFPLFRRRDPRAGRLDLRDRPRHRRLSFPRAARRRRPDHSVELPAADGGVEARARARRRQLRRAQARRTDARPRSWSGPRSSAISCPRACSTSSTASASRPASRSPRATASPRSPSPARRRPAGSSCNTPART